MAIDEPLQELLSQLGEAIDEAEAGGGDPAELRRLVAQVDRRLNDDDHDGIVDELQEEATRFEVSHPRLADALRRAVDALGALGL
jgi:hypothetical protein